MSPHEIRYIYKAISPKSVIKNRYSKKAILSTKKIFKIICLIQVDKGKAGVGQQRWMQVSRQEY